MKKILSSREENVVNALRSDGYTVASIANMFGVSVDVVRNANPTRRKYIAKYAAKHTK